jgi:hypothetical protein
MITKKDLREASYPIIAFEYVEAGDVDGENYFAGNVGTDIKAITYRDVNYNFSKKDVFTYQNIAGAVDNVYNIISISNELFKGVWATAAEPPKTQNGIFYYITKAVTIDGINYSIGDIIGLFDVGYGVLKWNKGKLNNEQKLRAL